MSLCEFVGDEMRGFRLERGGGSVEEVAGGQICGATRWSAAWSGTHGCCVCGLAGGESDANVCSVIALCAAQCSPRTPRLGGSKGALSITQGPDLRGRRVRGRRSQRCKDMLEAEWLSKGTACICCNVTICFSPFSRMVVGGRGVPTR